MRRRLLSWSATVAFAALTLAPVALAGDDDGGFSPPDPRSPNANRINDAYWTIFGFTSFIFVLVTGALLLFIWRYRSRSRDRRAEGAQVHGNTRLELAWTLLPVVILVAIGAVIFYLLPGIKNPPSASAQPNQIEVDVIGHRFYFMFRYPNGVVALDRMRAPVNTVVNMRITAPDDDVVHSWWIPELHGKQDAIPGQVNRMWFETDTVGTYEGQCTEFCGVQHAAMKATVEVMPRDEFDAWLTQQEQEQQGEATELGAEEWTAACAKCHGPGGEGVVGPNIAGNPLLRDRQALEQLVREGRGTMPPVGQDWTDDQIDALYRYVSQRIEEGGDEVGSEADPSGRGEQTEGEETGGD